MMIKSNNINKYFFLWIGICLAYILFIGYLTWLFPYGGDELLIDDYPSVFTHIKAFVTKSFMAIRTGCIVSICLTHMGKIFFDILNPFFQLSIIFSVFYLIYMRFPRFDSLEDFPLFVLLMALGTFFIAQPSETILWIGGATNYAWVFPAFIWFLIYLRKLEEGTVFKSKYVSFLCLIFGVILGFMNENNSPMVLCLMIAFAVYAHFKKIILRKNFWILMIVVAISVFFFFKFSGNDVRLHKVFLGAPMQHTIGEKLFMHILHMNNFAEANLWFIYLLPLGLVLLFLDKRKIVLKDKNFYLSVIFWLVAFGVSIVLFEAPRVATRAFYSASWFCIISFVFMLLEIEKIYKVHLIKYLALIFALIFLYVAPLFTLEVQYVKDSVIRRRAILDAAKQKGRNKVYLGYITPLELLPPNMIISYYDCMLNTKRWSKKEGIQIENESTKNEYYI